MQASDFKFPADAQFAKLEKLLNQFYDIKIDWSASHSYLESVMTNYSERKSLLISEGVSTLQSSDYSKSLLIVETINLYLREIAPMRKKKNRGK